MLFLSYVTKTVPRTKHTSEHCYKQYLLSYIAHALRTSTESRSSGACQDHLILNPDQVMQQVVQELGTGISTSLGILGMLVLNTTTQRVPSDQPFCTEHLFRISVNILN